ncbi:MAG TPA: protein translocase subunit SecD [Candidatus Acidoferrales bacterium]|nr:protein translocase subunit SecD [Candidatus Acidoferrales bacterium]
MNPQLKWKFVLILLVLLVCIFGVIGLPNAPTSLAQVRNNLGDRIHLGLDLKGGSHLVLQVQLEEAIAQHCDETVDELKNQLRSKNVGVGEIREVDDTHILVRNVESTFTGAFRDIINSQFTDWTMGPAAGETSGYLLTMKPSVIADIRQTTMNQTLETITRRINALGLTEPTIAFTGRSDDEILVQLPGVGDPTAAKEVIRAGGQLQLVRVADGPFVSEPEALAKYGGVLPPGTVLVPGRPESSGPSQPSGTVYYVLDKVPVVTGQDLRNADASPSTDNPGFYEVGFKLSTAAAGRFGTFTEQQAAIGGRMAVVLDRQVYEAATIKSRIEDSGRITGSFSQESAQDLALVLRAGALPASIKYLEERTVGPSLGADSIREGVRASIGSMIVVMIFLVIYYRLSGVNAVVALILNLVILVAFMAYLGAVLTLPGIAGVILTIGMGVDSNVLVFERIREELRNGKVAAPAVETGFDRAFLTIIDTHVTTVVSAIFLFLFGTGPVRGFAVTLVIGLSANLFTSIYVSRAIFDYHLSKMDRQAQLSI